jgi:hypothetical protein
LENAAGQATTTPSGGCAPRLVYPGETTPKRRGSATRGHILASLRCHTCALSARLVRWRRYPESDMFATPTANHPAAPASGLRGRPAGGPQGRCAEESCRP